MLSIALVLLAGLPQQNEEDWMERAQAMLSPGACGESCAGNPSDRYRVPPSAREPLYSRKANALADTGRPCDLVGKQGCPSDTHAFFRYGEDPADTIRASLLPGD